MHKYIVVTRKSFKDKLEIATESVGWGVAERYAQDLYYDLQLDMVMVAEVNGDTVAEFGVRLRKVMKIERTCKHPNLQGELFNEGGFSCLNCGMVFKPEVREVRSNIEQTLTPLGVRVG